MEHNPTYLVERDEMKEFMTGDHYRLSPSEQDWFRGHYELKHTFQYDPADCYGDGGLLLAIARLGSACDYHLHEKS